MYLGLLFTLVIVGIFRQRYLPPQ